MSKKPSEMTKAERVEILKQKDPRAFAIFEQVQKNNEALKQCPRHDFSVDLNPDRWIGKRWKCTNCNGEIDNSDKLWYETGLKHALQSAPNKKELENVITTALGLIKKGNIYLAEQLLQSTYDEIG